VEVGPEDSGFASSKIPDIGIGDFFISGRAPRPCPDRRRDITSGRSVPRTRDLAVYPDLLRALEKLFYGNYRAVFFIWKMNGIW
jgi:hypothetical protein